MKRALIVLITRLGPLAFKAAERSRFVRDRMLRPLTMRFVRDAVAAWRHGGTAAWNDFHLPAVRAAGAGRASYLLRKLAIDPSSARSLGAVHDYEDPLLGIEGTWAEEGRERAVRHETVCPIGDYLRDRTCPDFCRVLVHAFEEATLRAMNPRYELEPLGELISGGEKKCVFVHRVKGEGVKG